jgi:hypothetical protein
MSGSFYAFPIRIVIIVMPLRSDLIQVLERAYFRNPQPPVIGFSGSATQ